MGTIKHDPVATARTQLSGAGAAMNSLASGAYVVLGTINHHTADPLACKLEVSVTPGTVSGNQQLVVFAQASLDGSVFESGPTSGTTATDEPNLRFVGVVPTRTSSAQQRRVMDLGAAYPDGTLPHTTRLIAKNETGAALAATGHDLQYSEGWAITA